MNQSTAMVLAALIAYLGVLGTATASIIAVLLTSQKNKEIE